MEKTTEKWLKQARTLHAARFGVIGQGNFDLNVEQVAVLLRLLNRRDADQLVEDYFKQLEGEIFGDE